MVTQEMVRMTLFQWLKDPYLIIKQTIP